ncbi:MAG: DUF3634 family protein [Polyangiales bacterium]
MLAVQGTLVVVAMLALVWAATRARALCVLSVREGRMLIMRGSLPASLLEALADVVARDRTRRGVLQVLRDGDRARLTARGLGPEAAQRARNVLGTYTLTRLVNAPRTRRPNLGQRLGLGWLAWRLHDRRRGPRPPLTGA